MARVKALDLSPSRYIVKVERATGVEVPGPIDPEELLVHAHRDNHPVEIAAQFAASRFIELTGNEALVKRGLKAVDRLGGLVGEAVARATGSRTRGREIKRLLGVRVRDVAFRFRETTHFSEKEVKARVDGLQKEARARLRARGRNPRLRVLLTGATGFLGKEILAQAAGDRGIEEVVAVVRPETLRDPRTKAVLKVLSPRQRGALLLKRLHIVGATLAKSLEPVVVRAEVAVTVGKRYESSNPLDPDGVVRRDTIDYLVGVDFPLLHASAERVPLADASFDVVFCDWAP